MMEISKRKKIIISTVFVLFFAAAVHISAESIWEGSAAMGRYGEFPFTGYYGASNSFPQNAFVEVENLENGKRTRLIVVDRLSDSGLLMLVSNEAAQELGIYQNDIARIKVRMLSTANTVKTPQYDDLAYNPDPDLNPAAALMTPEELISQDISDSRTAVDIEPKAEPEPEEIVVPEPEPDLEVVTAPEPEPETEFPVLTELPPRTDGLAEAEILVTEEDVPEDISADTPEKPFDWPETIRTESEEVEAPEPLYLTMDDFEEGSPQEGESPSLGMHSPDTEILWPDGTVESEQLLAETGGEVELEVDGLDDASPLNPTDELGRDGLEIPAASLELLSSGLVEAEPAYSSEENFDIGTLPEIIKKTSDEELEYLTEATDYYNPEMKETEVSTSKLPAPIPEIPEEVIALLVGDHLLISGNEPENVEVNDSYIDIPEIIHPDDGLAAVLAEDLNEAFPTDSDETALLAAALPELPGADDSTLVDAANGYIIPDKAEYIGEITDFPDYAGASEPAEIPTADDALVYTDAPSEDEASMIPEMTAEPEVVTAAEDTDIEGELTEAVPEYDENLEISLVPAEVRPPELIEDETGLVESEPEPALPLETDIAGHEPEVDDQPAIVDAEVVEAPVETLSPERPVEAVVETTAVKPAAAEAELIVPAQVLMVSKLQQQRHYLQLGAFKEKNSAIKAAGKLEAVYPVTILTDETAASYKLLLGPLSADESGIMLYNFRAGGYSDAFIRRIE